MLKSPYPYFGGKSKIANLVWSRFGDVRNVVDPFFGSGAVLLARPQPFQGTETVNDLDGFIPNFWRAIKADPESVAYHADNPVFECDLHARHVWLVGQKDSLQARLEGDPDYYDPKIAGWWVWCVCCWIGGEFCSGKGPWQSVVIEDGSRQLVHLGNAGRGVKRQRVHLAGQGVNRKLVHLGDAGKNEILDWFESLAFRLARVRVCCGDWSRVCGPTPTVIQGLTAVFLDPPYADTAGRDSTIYRCDSGSIAHAVREWAIEHGDDPRLRIALCGYEGEHKMPTSWDCVPWKTRGGYGAGKGNIGDVNKHRERIWFSPHCVSDELPLFRKKV